MILKALSGFYYVDDGTQLFACRGRGKFRHEPWLHCMNTVCIFRAHVCICSMCHVRRHIFLCCRISFAGRVSIGIRESRRSVHTAFYAGDKCPLQTVSVVCGDEYAHAACSIDIFGRT